jgi:plasmid maintenance system antidote protein VapI
VISSRDVTMAHAQISMIVLDIGYQYLGHEKSIGASNMHLMEVLTKKVRDLVTSRARITDTFWLCLSISFDIYQPVWILQLVTAIWPLCRQKDNNIVFDPEYLMIKP